MFNGKVQPKGNIGMQVIRHNIDNSIIGLLKDSSPFAKNLYPGVRKWRVKNLHNSMPGIMNLVLYKSLFKAIPFPGLYATSALRLKIIKADGTVINLGLASVKVVTTTGVGFIVDAFQNLVELENMKFHGLGTGAAAEAAGDTALGTELTTQYNPDSTRATGTTTENGATVYRTVATNTVDASAAVTEHGILSQAATGGGVLLDRSVFSVINLANGDGIQSTYDLTLTAGG
jgi:hypothetical protein